MPQCSDGSTLQLAELDLRAFLSNPQICELVLPQFTGCVSVGGDLVYRGTTLSERDSRAAFHVQSLLSRVLEAGKISLRPATGSVNPEGLSFLFGSRSNSLTQAVVAQSGVPNVSFHFADDWEIRCGGHAFSIPDPSKFDPAFYASKDDYGVIARFRISAKGCVFIIAGLGGRATEGCGRYFTQYWQTLLQSFGNDNFALVLRFPAPFRVDSVEQAASSHWTTPFPVQ